MTDTPGESFARASPPSPRDLDAGRLDGLSSGEKSPIDAGRGEAAWAQNRRAAFVIVSGEVLLAMK